MSEGRARTIIDDIFFWGVRGLHPAGGLASGRRTERVVTLSITERPQKNPQTFPGFRKNYFKYQPFIGTKPTRSFTTSPPMIRPATEGTKALEPGTERRWVHLRWVPGGQMQ